MDFATRLTHLRKDMGLTQAELAKKTGISRSVLASYEATGKTPTLERMILLAKFFNVSLDYLVGISDSKNFRNSSETEELRLSEKSIEYIHSLHDSSYIIIGDSNDQVNDGVLFQNDIFSKILELKSFEQFIDHIGRFIFNKIVNENKTNIVMTDKKGSKIRQLTGKELNNIYKMEINELASRLTSEIEKIDFTTYFFPVRFNTSDGFLSGVEYLDFDNQWKIVPLEHSELKDIDITEI